MTTNRTGKPEPLQIPLSGGSGQVPTGAMQFRGDWPGLFIRGDTAVALAIGLRSLEKAVSNSRDPLVLSALLKLIPLAEIIEREVQVP